MFENDSDTSVIHMFVCKVYVVIEISIMLYNIAICIYNDAHFINILCNCDMKARTHVGLTSIQRLRLLLDK